MSRSGVKTMSAMKVNVKVTGKDVSLDSEVTYMRLMAINAEKKSN